MVDAILFDGDTTSMAFEIVVRRHPYHDRKTLPLCVCVGRQPAGGLDHLSGDYHPESGLALKGIDNS